MTVYRDPMIETKRIFCIGRNYPGHRKEMNVPPDSDCVIFMKPVSSLVPPGETVELPVGRGVVHFEAELVIALGFESQEAVPGEKDVPGIAAVTLGLDLTLRDLQNGLKKSGRPWEVAKAFDYSAPLGTFVPLKGGADELRGITFECIVDGERRQIGHAADMLFSAERIIEILGRTWKLKPGDIIFTGTPEGVGVIEPGSTVTLSGTDMGPFSWFFS